MRTKKYMITLVIIGAILFTTHSANASIKINKNQIIKIEKKTFKIPRNS